jgi:hypothetical protein
VSSSSSSSSFFGWEARASNEGSGRLKTLRAFFASASIFSVDFTLFAIDAVDILVVSGWEGASSSLLSYDRSESIASGPGRPCKKPKMLGFYEGLGALETERGTRTWRETSS